MEAKVENDKMTYKKRNKPNILSRIFLCWVLPVLYKGNVRDVEESDLINPPKKYDSEILGDRFERYWLAEVENAARNNRKPSLWKAMVRSFWLAYLPGAFLLAGNTAARTAQPLLFTQLLAYWSVESSVTAQEAGYYAMGMLGLTFFGFLCHHHNTLFVNSFSLKVKVGVSSLIYRKVLRMSQASLGEVAAGKLVNLLSNDVSRFDFAFMFLHYFWLVPIQLTVVLVLLYYTAGFAPYVGLFGVFILVLPVQAGLTKLTSIVRRATAQGTDKRIKLMNEFINGIQVIKMYAWEKPFQNMVRLSRINELKYLQRSIFVRSVFVGFMLFTERTTLFITCLTIVLTGSILTATTIYPIQQFFNIVQMNLTFILPIAIASLSEMFVALERIQGVLMMEERDDLVPPNGITNGVHPITFNGNKMSKPSDPVVAAKYVELDKQTALRPAEKPKISVNAPFEYAVEMYGVSASWSKSNDKMTLKNISMRLRKGKLCAIIGPVGSGKSSLLQVFLKEFSICEGSFNVNGRLSYACQESWLFPASVRDNILFGLPYDARKYKEVCRVCSLMPDFKQFPFGDQSLVGERGVSLSGGQRARINLARAVYREADIYLLDDPLSAVDANVGRQLFDECINGYLRDSTRILVTHQIHFLKAADYIVVLNDGAIENMGTYDELVKSEKEFSLLLTSLSESNTESEDGTGKTTRPTVERVLSKISVKSEDENEDEKKQTLEAEERAKGTLKWSVIANYLKSVESVWAVAVALFALLLTQGAATTADYWLSFWTNQVDLHEQSLPAGVEPDPSLDTQMGILTTGQYLLIYGCIIIFIIIITQVRIVAFVTMTTRASKNLHNTVFKNLINASMRFFDTNPSDPSLDTQMGILTTGQYLLIYGCIIIFIIIITQVRIVAFVTMTTRASKNLHNTVFKNLINASMRFFDTNPSGRILNRFSKDMGAMDELLPRSVLETLQMYLSVISILVLNAIALPWTLIPTVVLLFIFMFLLKWYIAASQAVKRLEGTTKSPVFSMINSTIAGLSTIRSSNSQNRLLTIFDQAQDLNTSAFYTFLGGSSTFGFYLDVLCLIYLAIIIAIFLLFDFGNIIPVGSIGLAVSQSMVLVVMLQMAARITADFLGQMTSVERVLEYSRLPAEDNMETGPTKPSKDWPSKGRVKFENVCLRYDPDDPLVLKNLTFEIESGWKVGIVGRTGAGKSSLISALFRLSDIDGSIKIDGIDTQDVGKAIFRSKISIIPQEPVLFSASLRYNLDPFDSYDDDEIWRALEQVELKDAIPALDFKVSEGGANFSVGQRQLVCLARAILRSNRILVMDEATANVDPQTDALIQTTIRKQFAACTVLTIAHRLNTIMDSDRVLVMDKGEVVEYDYPYRLLQNPNSKFTSMVRETGEMKALFEVAKAKYLSGNPE
ncbi:ABC transporter C family member 12 [Papilio machaon]|uniref:ABC transporter C family member 12 n=1 Tax=Papilio machaon TaxID=76193 RepID=A0A194R6X8_PAPMA|nr:ABC transporter C family member 12 [Papilio machaon]